MIIRRRSTTPRTAAVDLAAAVRRADRDGDPVGGGDEPGLAVARSLSAHEQDERQAGHPVGSRATMLQARSDAAYWLAKSSRYRATPRASGAASTLRG